MAPQGSNPWTTDPDYIDLLNYVIQNVKDAKSPIDIYEFVRDFKKTSGAAQTENCLQKRIKRMRTRICSFEHIDKGVKVKLLFALGASIDADFLEELKKEATVEVDDNKRIKKYEAIDGSLELNGMSTAMLATKGSLRSLIINHFERKDNADAVPKNKEDKEMGTLIEFITEKCVNVDTPLRISRLAEDFKNHFGISVPLETVRFRIGAYCREIQNIEFTDTHSKVKQLFGLSVTLDLDCLEKLRTEALVDVDEKNRITNYKDGTLELKGDHSLSAKNRNARLESKGSLRSMIKSYFENKNNTAAVHKDKKDKEMRNFIEYITEKSENVHSPLNISQLTRDFNKHFGISRPLNWIYNRIKGYCREIQRLEFLDTHTKVKQLFGLSATVDLDCLETLRKNALVEVDQKNRIIKHTANDGSLTLQGSPYGSKKAKPKRVKKTNMDNVVTTADDSEEESDNERFTDSSDKYSSEEFDSEFDSDDENDDSEVAEDLVKSTNEAIDFDNETPVSNRSPTDMSIGDNLVFDSPSVRSHRSEETERSEDEESNPEIIGNTSVKTRYGRVSKRRYLDSEVSYNQENSSSSEVPMSTDSLSPKIAKQKKNAIQKKQASRSSNQSRSSSRSMRRSTRNSSFPSISTESEEKIENQDAVDFENKRSIRNSSPAKVSTAENFDFDHSPEKSHLSEEIEMGENEEKENDTRITGNGRINEKYESLSKRRYSDSEEDSDFHPEESDDENDDLEKSQDLMEPSNEAYDFDNETSVRSHASSGISTDNNFDFDLPTEMREDDEKDDPDITENAAVEPETSETFPKNKTSSSTSHTPKTPKRKAGESAGSNSSKRTKPPSNESMNPKEVGDNFSHDDPSRVDLNPVCGPLGLSNETQKDSDVQEIPKPRPQVMEAPIKEEYEEETQTSLETVLKAFKSLIISLDTPRLSQFLIELDTKIMESGRRSEISNKEVTVAMDFLIVKLSKHGAPESSEDSISLRDILLMLRTIILNSSFDGLEEVLEMLKKNIEQLKVLDKKVPVSKVESVLRATLDNIST